ncbi:response regulator [Alisedimentitalea sp. MJ-SS2]|uniref:response regulator n=1 Tax=Aliisedimentitalea sp. MJ-SS2 TaxID=3049795 RepID=UPI00290CDF04|nr:response regulator [Alisedimentitalea sp. MJ-SS2]MDU8926863.1 response regulator [Alisedimentitalea sp. MJ-SS2]
MEKKNRVLVVDDEPSILELLRTALVALGGYEVETARSGREALAMLGDDRPMFDLILLDIQMPEMNGVDVCAAIRETLGYRFVPIIMLTAMSQMDYVDKAFLAGATDYVTKPFDFDDLSSRLDKAFAAYRDKTVKAPTEGELAPLAGRKHEPRLRFETKIEFDGVDRFLETERFDNYVRQMAGSRAPHTSAFAVKVSNGYYLHRALNSEEFTACLEDVANLLSQMTEKTGSLLSYRGRGIFLCVEYGNRLSETTAIEHILNAQVRPWTERKTRPKIVVSAHAQLKQNSRASAGNLMDDAISKVDSQVDTHPVAACDPSEEAMHKRIHTVKTKARETRAYRDILSSVLRGS